MLIYYCLDVNFCKFSKVLYQVEYPNECPLNDIVFDDQCKGKLYECNLIPANKSCLCICDGLQDRDTKRFIYTGVIQVEKKELLVFLAAFG